GHSVPELCHQRHTHIQSFPGGDSATLWKWIQADVDMLVSRQVPLSRGCPLERDPGRRYVVTSKPIKQRALDGGIVKQLVLNQQPRRDVGVQNPRPDLD